MIVCVLPYLTLWSCLCVFGQAVEGGRGAASGVTVTRSPGDNPESLAHIDAARKLAGSDPVLTTPLNFFCAAVDYNKPGPQLEPVKVFDNLFAIPSSPIQQTTIWAITTRDGIILIDSGQQGRTEAILSELQTVGLNPANVKYILLGHGHGDHFAGARYFQDNYGTKVGAAAADWDLMYPSNPPAGRGNQANQSLPPHRGLVLEEGKDITLGEETVHVFAIPGHTPGSLAFIFNVKDNGQTHTAGLFGGTILDQGRIKPDGLRQYIQSIDHYLEAARKMKVDVEIQNHALFDDTPGRLAKVKMRKPGEPNPFLITTGEYVKFWGVVSECIEAEIARRETISQ
jgi:metallo-beta-lactamase class B